MIKIMFITSSFGGGGITSYAHEVINCYKSDYELCVVVGSEGEFKIQSDTVRVFHIESEDLSVINAKNLLRLISEENPHVIINSSSKLASLILPYISDDIVYISVSHSLKYTEAEIAGFNSIYSDKIIALSEYGRKYLEKRFSITKDDKIVAISNFSEPLDIDGLERNRQDQDFRIVFSGGSSPVKTPDLVAKVLLSLLKTNLKFQFYWVGNTRMALYRFSYLKDIKQLFDTDPRLHFTGRVTRNEAQRLASTANAYIFPSRREGSPMSLLEALSGGAIPLVADYNNANREIVEKMEIGYVLSKNHPEEFVQWLSKLINREIDQQSMHSKIIEYYRKHYTREAWSEKMNNVLQVKGREHKKRDNGFCIRKFLYDRMRLQLNVRRSFWSAFYRETLPAVLNLNKLFIKNNI